MARLKKYKDSSYWDERLSWASVLFFICDAANATVKMVLPIPESLWGAVSAAFGMAIILGYAINFKEMLRRSSKIFWRVFSIFIAIYTLSAVICTIGGYPITLLLKSNALATLLWWIPSGVFASSVKDKSILYNVWIKSSYVISAICIALFFFHSPNEEQGSVEYSMSFGLKIILPLLIQMNDFVRNKRIWLLLFILFQIGLILIYANRGPLLSIIFFCIYKFAFESESRFRKIISFFVLGLAVIIMLSSLQAIAESAISILNIFGFESRTLDLIAAGIGDKTSGRDGIWEICWKMIQEKPVLGWGLGGEYYRIGADISGTPVAEVTAEGHNPHNGIVQNFVCFGIFGGLISTFIVLFPLLHLKRYKDVHLHDLLVIFAAASVIPLCISGCGFFIKPGVAIFLFLFYNSSRKPYLISVAR